MNEVLLSAMVGEQYLICLWLKHLCLNCLTILATYLFSVEFGGLASGCPKRLLESNPNDIQNSQDMISDSQTSAVRCCSLDGGSCESKIPDCSTLTFSNARRECSRFGMRLCTEEELASNICCGTGCEFDIELVWYAKGNVILLSYHLLSKL